MDAKTLEALAARCEAAQGADHVLDNEIARAICPGATLGPAYTASLETAMTLVPEGWRVTLEFGHGDGYAFVRNPIGSQSGNATANDAALALTAACLRALSTKEPNNV